MIAGRVLAFPADGSLKCTIIIAIVKILTEALAEMQRESSTTHNNLKWGNSPEIRVSCTCSYEYKPRLNDGKRT